MSGQRSRGHRPLARSLKEYARGITGGLIFSLPLLYTSEVWELGHLAHSSYLIGYLVVIFALLLGYNRFAGMRRDANWWEVAVDSVEEMGLGLVLAAVILWLSGRIGPDVPVNDVVGQIVVAAMTVAVGVSVGTSQLGDESVGGQDAGMERRARDDTAKKEVRIGHQLSLAVCGAVLFAANIGPTQEIVTIALETSSTKLLGLALGSLLLGGTILFYSDFARSRTHAQLSGLGSVFVDIIITYAIALVISATILWSVGRFQGLILVSCVSQTVVLGLVSALGASAGRLLLQ